MDKTSRRGASDLEILEEPEWTQARSHSVGTHGRDIHSMGVTHDEGEWYDELEHAAKEKFNELREKMKRGELVTVRDLMAKQHVRFWQHDAIYLFVEWDRG